MSLTTETSFKSPSKNQHEIKFSITRKSSKKFKIKSTFLNFKWVYSCCVFNISYIFHFCAHAIFCETAFLCSIHGVCVSVLCCKNFYFSFSLQFSVDFHNFFIFLSIIFRNEINMFYKEPLTMGNWKQIWISSVGIENKFK
jgi:hypothetical protein